MTTASRFVSDMHALSEFAHDVNQGSGALAPLLVELQDLYGSEVVASILISAVASFVKARHEALGDGPEYFRLLMKVLTDCVETGEGQGVIRRAADGEAP